ncbi:MAG: dienelactone hydrolase family protein [Rhodocyclaceae bacterium]
MRALCLLLVSLFAGQVLAAEAGLYIPVSIPPAGLSSSPSELRAQLFKPATPGPHPAVVMIHGCGGAYAKDGKLNARHQMWGEYLAANGYVALMLDSFSARGLDEICTQKHTDRTIKESDRVGDTYAALAWLRQQDGVDAKRVALLGWSHGAGVTLDAIRRQPKAIDKGFTAAVSFYPGCTNRNKKADSFKPYAPLMILIGEADDWTPAAPCVALTNTARALGATMQIHTYPGAYHDFDNPGLSKLRLRKDVPNGVNPGQGVHTGPDPEAREDAKKRVLQFFAEQLK